jgi:hypothetical protein
MKAKIGGKRIAGYQRGTKRKFSKGHAGNLSGSVKRAAAAGKQEEALLPRRRKYTDFFNFFPAAAAPFLPLSCTDIPPLHSTFPLQ